MNFATHLLTLSVSLLLLAAPLSAANDPTPPGAIDNPAIRGAVNMYRDYMSCATIASLQHLRTNEPDQAATIQNYLLLEIVAEMEPSLKIYSHPQRKATLELFQQIEDYYRQHPWPQQKWNQSLADSKKEGFAEIDELRRAAMAKDWSTVPEGKLKDSEHMPALIDYRAYMAATAIELLKQLEADEVLAAEQQLETALDQLLEAQVTQAERLATEWVDREAESRVKHTLYRIDNHYTEFPRASTAASEQLAALDQRRKQALEGYRYMGGMSFFGVK